MNAESTIAPPILTPKSTLITSLVPNILSCNFGSRLCVFDPNSNQSSLHFWKVGIVKPLCFKIIEILFEQGLISYKDLSNEMVNIIKSKKDEIVFKLDLPLPGSPRIIVTVFGLLKNSSLKK